MLLVHYKGSASFGPSTGEQFRYRLRWFHARTSQWICSLATATHIHTLRSTRRYLGLCFDAGHCHDCGGSVSAACFPITEGCLHLGGVCFASTQKLLISFQLLLPSTVLFYLENAIFCSLSAIIAVVTARRRFQLARVVAAVLYYSICSKLCFCLITVAFANHYFLFDPMMVHR